MVDGEVVRERGESSSWRDFGGEGGGGWEVGGIGGVRGEDGVEEQCPRRAT